MSSENELPPHILKPEKHLKRAQGYFALDMFESSQVKTLPKGGVEQAGTRIALRFTVNRNNGAG